MQNTLTKTEREPFGWLNRDQKLFLERGYLLEGQQAVDRIRYIADHAEKLLGIKGFSDKFFDYMSKGWFSLSSPIWSNYGLERGLPISCFGSYIGDQMLDISSTVQEVMMMSKYGGGTSAYFGHIRPRGSLITNNGKSDGSFNFSKLFDTVIDVVSQGTTRRAQFAGYIDIEHADIDEWLDIHTEGNPIQLMYYGVCIGHKWLEEMKAGDQEKRKIWGKLIQRKFETGIPYIFFKDNVNANRPDVYIDKGMNVYAQNMCTEICLSSSIDESFVCCLSSMNLHYYDEWKDTDAVEILTYFLDSVMTDFIDRAKNYHGLEKAVRFAERQRALGLGVLGYHSYLQSKMIPFESQEAFTINNEIFELLQQKTLKASKELADQLGEPELLKGYGRRNTTLMTIAPTKSSSYILGQVSASIEPLKSNYFIKDVAKAKSIYKNPYLDKLLTELGQNTEEVWKSIEQKNGSVQHLQFLSKEQKDVFKTFHEISPLVIIQQAAQRQQYIDQSQSLNLMIDPSTPKGEVSKLYLLAEELGIKSLYYQYSFNAAQEVKRNIANNQELTGCATCEA